MTLLRNSNNDDDKHEEGSEKDLDLAEAIVGKAPRIVPLVRQHPNVERLRAPLLDGNVIRGYCTFCNSYPEYTMDNAHALAEFIHEKLPGNLDEHYFEVNGCEACLINRECDPEIALFPIPE